MRNDEGGEGKHGEGMKREGRSKMAWKERRARARVGEMDKTGACSGKNRGRGKGGGREKESQKI